MADDLSKTISPREARKSGVHVRIIDHIQSKDGGWKLWLAAISGGLAIVSLGVGSLVLVAKVPWWASFAVIASGLQIGSRGAFGEGLLAFKDAAIDLMKAKKEAS